MTKEETKKKILEMCTDIKDGCGFTVSEQAVRVMENISDFPYEDFAKFVIKKKFHIGGQYLFEYLDRYYPDFKKSLKEE